MDEFINKPTSSRDRLLRRMNEKLESLKTEFSPETVSSIQESLPALADRLSAYNPKKNVSRPSYVEKAIDAALGIKEPENDIHIGKPPSEADTMANIIHDRELIVREAMIANSTIDSSMIRRLTDAMCNQNSSVPDLKLLAVLDTSPHTVQIIRKILDDAGMTMAGEAALEALAAVSRGILRYMFTSHKCEYKKSNRKTPFEAWRMRDYIYENNMAAVLKPINLQGFDNREQIAEFRDNFKAADIVLWNTDIWMTAIRGYESFEGTILEKDLVESITPMFWQYESEMALGRDAFERGLTLDGLEYDCVGFSVMPTTESFVDIKIPDGDHEGLKKFKKYGREFVRIDSTSELGRSMLDDAVTHSTRFARRGISVAIIYVSPAEPIPEIRFVEPIFEGDVIEHQIHGIILAGAKFLTLKYVGKDTAPISKKELKADRELFKKVRKGKVNVPPIKVINLRRAERRYVTPREASDEKRHLTCHFIRDAHWRKQPYPSQGVIKVIRIEEMVVGDTSLPFKPPRRKVYKAVR